MKNFEIPAVPSILYLFLTAPLIVSAIVNAIVLYMGGEVIKETVLGPLKQCYMFIVPGTIATIAYVQHTPPTPGTHEGIIDNLDDTHHG